MDNINALIGSKVRNYRKMKKLTLQQLADAIHKSRATVSKYETGEIALDVGTLYDIGTALDVNLSQLTDCRPPKVEEETPITRDYDGESPFFKADRLYFYFYDGRYKRLKEAVIDVNKRVVNEDGSCEASMSICATTKTGRSSEIYYSGSVLYSDMLIRFTFVNRCNKLEQDLLYIFNPLEIRAYTEGLLCGINTADLMPCAFKCLVALAPSEDMELVKERLLITAKDLKRWKKMNMLIVDNNG